MKHLSKIILGTMGYGGYFKKITSTNIKKYHKCFHTAFDHGIRSIDTAEVYANGYCEEIIGKLDKNFKKKLYIISKFSSENSSHKKVKLSLEKSLKRLNIEQIDLYMPHWPNPSINYDETLSSLKDLKKEGKIIDIGLSNFDKETVLKINDDNNIKYFQNEYSLAERNIEKKFLPYINKINGRLLAYSPLQQGRLLNLSEKTSVGKILNKYSCTLPQLLINILAIKKNVHPIIKSQKIYRIIENAKALNYSIEKDDIKNIKNIFKPKIIEISIDRIIPYNVKNKNKKEFRKEYLNLKDAVNNAHKLVPGPVEVAKEIKDNNGKLSKPIKLLKLSNSNKFLLVEGRLKFWAWQIIYKNKKPIPSIITY